MGLGRRRDQEAARAAWLYHVEDETQEAIAAELGVSRSTVVRLLQRAKDDGLVRVIVDAPASVYEDERGIAAQYGLDRVRVVPASDDQIQRRRWLGIAAADVLVDLVEPATVVAVGWGSTLEAMADALPVEHPVEGLTVVPLVGGLHRANNSANSSNLANQIARSFGADSRALYAPVFVEEPAAAAVLSRQTEIRETLELARGAALAVFGVGDLGEDATLSRLGYLTPEDRDALREGGVVGEAICRFIDREGNECEGVIERNAIGLRLEELRAVPHRLLVAGGPEKADVVHALLSGGHATTLVADESVAVRLLDG